MKAMIPLERPLGHGKQANLMTIPAKYENGVFRPLGAVQIRDGTVVEVYVPSEFQARRPKSVRDFAFCGMWKDREEMADSVAYVNRLREYLRG
jgi:predicted DNA-binding antitoxin AbrB/MazE fold protein